MFLNSLYIVIDYLKKLYTNFKSMIIIYVDDDYDIAMNFVY